MAERKPGITGPEIPGTPRTAPEIEQPAPRREPEIPAPAPDARPEVPAPGVGRGPDATPPRPDRISPPADPSARR